MEHLPKARLQGFEGLGDHLAGVEFGDGGARLLVAQVGDSEEEAHGEVDSLLDFGGLFVLDFEEFQGNRVGVGVTE